MMSCWPGLRAGGLMSASMFGHVPLQPDQTVGPGQAGLVQGGATDSVGDEAGFLRAGLSLSITARARFS